MVFLDGVRAVQLVRLFAVDYPLLCPKLHRGDVAVGEPLHQPPYRKAFWISGFKKDSASWLPGR